MIPIKYRQIISVILYIIVTFISFNSFAGDISEDYVGKIVSVQGIVRVQRINDTNWKTVNLNDILFTGDTIKTMKNSRAVVVLYNEGAIRLGQESTLTLIGKEEKRTFLLQLLIGIAHFFSREPRSLKVGTPFVNGSIEGTEFYARVDNESTLFTVFKGRVMASNSAGSLILSSGQSAITKAGKPPEVKIIVKPRDAVNWALYYPAIQDYKTADFKNIEGEKWQGMIQKSIESYTSGDLYTALSSLDEAPENIDSPRFYTYRAGLLLLAGRVDKAQNDIDKAIKLDPSNSNAISLQSIIALAQNRKDESLHLAQKAVAFDPKSPTARIAFSYSQQAYFDLNGALQSLKEAVELGPENALALARLAEIWLSLGYLDNALETAQKAVEFNPNLSRTQTVLGFANLTQIKINEAKGSFEKAILLDQSDPLPRLGNGLAKIRDGDIEEGRKDIEIASALDPNNSLIRSYLGKAYFEEKRTPLDEEQYKIAKELDPLDPTPWFYDAIRKQTMNRPVEALYDLQKSIELNDNRAIYRSRLLLDEDLAARSASLGRIYNDLGFQKLALVEGWKSVNTDPSSYSAHRFLADSYGTLPRHNVARVSELLQSQLLQPLNLTPIQPHLAESNSYIYDGTGPSAPSFNEYNPLFTRNNFSFQTSGIAGDNSTLGDELVFSGLLGRLSYSIGQFHYETNGFRENNDQDQDLYNTFIQMLLTPKTSIQGEFRYKDMEKGDLSIRFHSSDIALTRRDYYQLRSERFGFHHAFSPNSELIGSFIKGREETDILDHPNVTIPFPPFEFAELQEVKISPDLDGYLAEIQHLFSSEHFHIITGAGLFDADSDEINSMIIQILEPPMTIPVDILPLHEEIQHTNLYVYTFIKYPFNLTWTIGASADFYDDVTTIDQEQINPKLGISWNPYPSTTIRATAFRTLRRSLFYDQTIEPTQIAGFNQFYDDPRATDSKRWGLGIDQKITSSFFGGVEISMRDLDVVTTDLATSKISIVNWQESLGRAYLYWTLHHQISILSEYQYERFEWDTSGGLENATKITTHRLPLSVNYFHPSGITATLKATCVYQKGDYGNYIQGIVEDDDQFMIVDASIRYRLPKRYGLLTLEVKNLFGKDFQFQDTDSANPQIYPERFVFARFTFVY